MARFVQQKDLAFFEKISKELVDVVVQTTVEIFKLSISESRTNLYGESLGKSYLPSVQCACMIERDESVIDYEGFGFDRSQNVEFRFNRATLEEKNLFPEIGDIVDWNEGHWEITSKNENQLVGGQTTGDYNFSVVCEAYLTRLSHLNIERMRSI